MRFTAYLTVSTLASSRLKPVPLVSRASSGFRMRSLKASHAFSSEGVEGVEGSKSTTPPPWCSRWRRFLWDAQCGSASGARCVKRVVGEPHGGATVERVAVVGVQRQVVAEAFRQVRVGDEVAAEGD